MNIQRIRPSYSRFAGAVCFALLLLCRFAPVAKAVVFQVTMDTTALNGQTGLLAFDLIGGDAVAGNNRATAGAFSTNGTVENSSVNVVVTDTGFFNEELRAMTFGTFFNFTVTLTDNHATPGVDQFSFFFLDDATFLPLFGTSDPTGAHALFASDLNGTGGGGMAVFESLARGITWQVILEPTSSVPDRSSTIGMWAFVVILGAVGRISVGRLSCYGRV